jgi:hypothetical protein
VKLRSIVTRTATIALAAAALAAPAASARPADTPVFAKTTAAATQQKQDLRSPDAIDAATRQKQDMRSPDAIDAATRPAPGEQVTPRPETPPQAAGVADGGWDTIAIGIAGGLLAVGAIAGIASRSRRARVTA